jgi:8-oxo-dGTP pyrophosphatase MutT (NUDIX family)
MTGGTLPAYMHDGQTFKACCTRHCCQHPAAEAHQDCRVLYCCPAEVDLATSHREFSEWRWMPLQQLPGAVVPFKRPVYEAVLAEFVTAVEALKAEAPQQ